MGAKPRKKPLTFDDLVSGSELVKLGSEIWRVTRFLLPEDKATEMKMIITNCDYQRITRGVNKGGHRMTLVVEYMDDTDENYE